MARTSMAGTLQLEANSITLKGSTDIVAEFFSYGINSILYQRGVYPPETFAKVQKYGVTLFVSTDETLKNYIEGVLSQVREWLQSMTVQKLVIVIISNDTNETLERWQFDVDCKKNSTAAAGSEGNSTAAATKSEKEVSQEIASVMKQIVACVSFLPLLDAPCSFDILVYTDKGANVPEVWTDSGPCFIANSEQVKLRHFSTGFHKVDGMVAYKINN